ncbi:class I SAM-dependent DNA methyltransferase [Streptomyces sp. PAN_FS17]|uniref:HsdM family class I SAM-dependent methyltransferase n=1 Tax=Streptomyces sp. PAN_FS17 TaxID=1855351 RepID=UPI0015A52CE6|nr:N-6 DNA methylase [Streptomyces sp. PAN_FS17]
MTELLMNYCTVLCDRGLSTVEAVEQLTYLLMLKLEDESLSWQRELAGESQPAPPEPDWWGSLTGQEGDSLVAQFSEVLAHRSHHGTGTMLDGVFAGAQNHIHDAGLLRRLVHDLFHAATWSEGTDVLGEAYDALLERAMNDVRSGAGQYFTPRPLIDAIVKAIQPELTDTIADPACGTGGFLIGVHDYLAQTQLARATPDEWARFRTLQMWGHELVAHTAQLASANLLLHGIASAGQPALIKVGDALAQPPDRQASLVLAHPPFGRHAAVPVGPLSTARRDALARADFVTGSIDKQVNFLQHVMSLTARSGRAAVVVPDSILFATGAAETVRRHLLEHFDVHTVLRLPVGILYSVGITANVVFFDRPSRRTDDRPQTTKIWVYDLRSGRQFAPNHDPLLRSDLDDFVSAYLPGRQRTDRVETNHFRCFDIQDVLDQDQARLDLTWSLEPIDAGRLAPPGEIAREVVHDLRLALEEFEELAAELHGESD